MLPEDVVQARTRAQQSTASYGEAAAGEPTISDVLKQKITEAYQANQDIVKPLDVATQDYLGAPQAGREQYQNIFNPFQRENLVSQYIGTKALPMLSLSNILGNRMGRIEDTIGAGTNAYKADVLAKQAQAGLDQDLYDKLLSEFTTTEQLKGQAEERQISRERLEFDKTQGGEGGTELLASLLPLLLGQGTDTSNLEEPPYESPLNQSTQVEWPAGSGVFWAGDGKGGWI